MLSPVAPPPKPLFVIFIEFVVMVSDLKYYDSQSRWGWPDGKKINWASSECTLRGTVYARRKDVTKHAAHRQEQHETLAGLSRVDGRIMYLQYAENLLQFREQWTWNLLVKKKKKNQSNSQWAAIDCDHEHLFSRYLYVSFLPFHSSTLHRGGKLCTFTAGTVVKRRK